MNRFTLHEIDALMFNGHAMATGRVTREELITHLLNINGDLSYPLDRAALTESVWESLVVVDATRDFVREGAPVVSITREQAIILTEVDPPSDQVERIAWPFRTACIVIDIGDDGCLTLHRNHPCTLATGAALEGILGAPGALQKLYVNLAYFLAHPESLPEAWTLREQHPSPVAERKRAKAEHRKPRHLPGTLWVLGTTRNLSDLGREREHSEPGDRAPEKSWKWGVRTWRSAHYRWQAYGPQWSKRRLVYIDGHEMGNPDAPLSVHALRIA